LLSVELLQLLPLEQDLPLLQDFAFSSFFPNHFLMKPMASRPRAGLAAERSSTTER
jgi:hypothetical protein